MLVELLMVLPYALGAAAVPFAIRAERRARRAQVARWRSVAETLELSEIESAVPWFDRPRLNAHAGNRRVIFERFAQSKHVYLTRVTVEGSSGLTLRPEDSNTAWLNEREIELGDEAFDAAVHVQGAPERVRTLLDAETRGIVRQMLGGRVQLPGRLPVIIGGTVVLINGDLRADFAERPIPPTAEELVAGTGALLALSARFQRPDDLAAHLAGALEREPEWRVRLHGLELLSASYPNDPATVAALRRGLADLRAEVRIRAAVGLGDEGTATLLQIASGEAAGDAIAGQAVEALAERLPVEVGVSLLRQALRVRRLRTAGACIQGLGQVGGPEAVSLLAKVLATETVALAAAAAQALGKTGAAAAEDALLDALDRAEPELLAPTIEALGHAGSARAVPAIKDAAARPDSGADVRRAARQAVAEIHSRLLGASPGQLSIAEGEAGQLSLADDDPRGRVSLPEER